MKLSYITVFANLLTVFLQDKHAPELKEGAADYELKLRVFCGLRSYSFVATMLKNVQVTR